VWIEDQGDTVLIKSFPSDVDLFLAHLRQSTLPIHNIAVVDEEEKDYVAEVRRHFTPVRIGGLTILPPWRTTRRKGPILIIEPGMAFGTGRHESTKLMIKTMGGVDIRGKRVLDIGSGSGILAMYARLLGASQVVAIDHDPLAAEAARKSCGLNGISDILLACADVESLKGDFELVLANLDFGTFRRHARDVMKRVGNGGSLIISGIENQFAPLVPSLFGPSTLVRRSRMRDWHAFVFRVDKD
jgi:ribosomal protein L11 methyltransferase